MPAHVAAVLSLALLSIHARASDEVGESPWDDGVRAELEEADDRGDLDAELAPEALLLREERDRVLFEDERDARE